MEIEEFQQLKELAESVECDGDYWDLKSLITSIEAELNQIKVLAFNSLCDHQHVKIGDKIDLFDGSKHKGTFIVTGWEIWLKKLRPTVAKIKKDGTAYGVDTYVSFNRYEKFNQ